MRFPTMDAPKHQQSVMDRFSGYNHTAMVKPWQFYDMINMSSNAYPLLSSRPPRGTVSSNGNIQGLAAKDGLCYVDGHDLVINGSHTDMGLSVRAEDCPKQLVSMGAYLIIMPDRMFYNTADPTDHGPIDARYESQSTVSVIPCRANGETMRAEAIQPSAPENPTDKSLWVDTSTTPHTVKEYSALNASWITMPTTYVKIQAAGIGRSFREMDGVRIKWGSAEAPAPEEVQSLSGSHLIQAISDDYIVVIGMLDNQVTVDCNVTVTRSMPLMDYVVESGNRLWGCRYGLDADGEIVNELYASKLGDFRNWESYQGISTDSYRVSLGSDGPFTGAIAHANHPIFFKEQHMHKVFGQMPSNFQVQSTPCRGVQEGSSRSLAIVNEVLYYKSTDGICAYDGSVPATVSTDLGDTRYSNVVAAAFGSKYYASMQREDGQWDFLVFDAAKSMWHKEDNLQAYLMCPCHGDLFCVDAAGRLLALMGTTGEPEEQIPWMLETGMIGASDMGYKYLRKIRLRFTAEVGSTITMSAQYDSMGPWEDIGSYYAAATKAVTFPLIPRRCDHLRLRLSGQGKVMIYAIAREMGGGSTYDY